MSWHTLHPVRNPRVIVGRLDGRFEQTAAARGLWYAFTAGSERVVSIANDDVCYQHGGDSYVRGYSSGAQKAWLEKATSTTTNARIRCAGMAANETLTPPAAATGLDTIDTDKGTVRMGIGGGGTSAPSKQLFFDPPQCRVITSVGAPDPATGRRSPVYVTEQAP